MREARKVDRRNRHLFGMAAGVAGIGAALGLASDLPVWIGVMMHPSNWSLPILALSLAIVAGFFLKYRGYYEKRKVRYRIALGVTFAGSVGVMVSHAIADGRWICGVSTVVFFVGCVMGLAWCRVAVKRKGRERLGR